METIKIAGITVNQTPIDWSNNLSTILEAIQDAKNQEIKFACFPELAVTGYGCQDIFLSNWIYQRAETALQTIIPKTDNICVLVGLPVKVKNENYNAVAVICNKQLVGITAKQHLANNGVHYESRWFKAWPKHKIEKITFANFEVDFGDIIYRQQGLTFGIEICEDAWVGKNRPGYDLVKRGAKMIFNPSASHFAFGKTLLREELAIPFSKETCAAFLSVNMLGNEAGRMIFDGDIILAQNGVLMAKNKRFSMLPYQLLTAEINPENFDESRRKNFSDSTEKFKEFTGAVTLGLFDYLRKTKVNGFTLSLSGGADSAACAVLVSEMVKRGILHLGTERFLESLNLNIQDEKNKNPNTSIQHIITGKILNTVYQSTRNSSTETFEAAKCLAESIGADFFYWTIDDEITEFIHKVEFVVGRPIKWTTDDIALQNVQARTRIPGIWMLANVLGNILLTTSNRSEASVGYATMDGDSSGSLAPIAGVDKFFILNWLAYAEETLGYNGLNKTNKLEPTAELRPLNQNQTDERDLMPYHILNEIESCAIGKWLSPKETFLTLKNTFEIPQGKLKDFIAKFYRLWSLNQWKRERFAPSFHLDNYNVDPKTWCRFPIISGNFETEITELMNA